MMDWTNRRSGARIGALALAAGRSARAAGVAAAMAAALAAPSAALALECGDLDNNGSIATSDALRLLRKAVGLDVTIQCPAGEDGPFDASAILTDFAEETVFLTYEALAEEADRLHDAIEVLAGNPTVANLEAAQAQWRATRRPWESSEGFLFGPVDEGGFDPRLDSWPVNKVDLDNILDSEVDLTDAEVIDALDNSVKGFHTIEYLLFDDGSGTAPTLFFGSNDPNDIVDALEADPRRIEYLLGVTDNLTAAATELADAWDPADGNFAAEVSEAGKTSTRWLSQQSAMQEIVEALVGIADEVANGKITDPFQQEDPRLVESQFSFNSLTDFTNNMESIRNVYEGSTPQGCSAAGVSSWVATVDPALDAKIRDEIEDAKVAINAIEEPFRDSISDDSQDDEIENAIAAINVLRVTLEQELMALVVDEGDFAF
jgi:putative iron-regulated protein